MKPLIYLCMRACLSFPQNMQTILFLYIRMDNYNPADWKISMMKKFIRFYINC